jgi:hypothetical protein
VEADNSTDGNEGPTWRLTARRRHATECTARLPGRPVGRSYLAKGGSSSFPSAPAAPGAPPVTARQESGPAEGAEGAAQVPGSAARPAPLKE